MRLLSKSFSARAALFAGLLMACGLAAEVRAQNLLTNGSFENGSFVVDRSFVDSNNAMGLGFWNFMVSKWTPNASSTWIQDAVRAEDGSRFVYLGPQSGTDTYISQPVSTLSAGGSLQSNQNYHLSLGYDFFDVNDPHGAAPMDSAIEVYYVLGTYMFMGDPNNPMLMDESTTRTLLFSDSGLTDSWDNGANMNWQTCGIDFTAPSLTGYDYLRIYISAPEDTPGNPSMGVLVDNVSLNLAVIPEPGSLLLVVMGVLSVGRRRL